MRRNVTTNVNLLFLSTISIYKKRGTDSIATLLLVYSNFCFFLYNKPKDTAFGLFNLVFCITNQKVILGEKENFLMLNIKKCYVYNQQRSQDFSLEVAKLKDNIKSEINLKNINQQ